MYISGALGSNAAFGGVRMLANQTTRTSTTISNGGTLRTLMSDGRYLYTSYSGSANPNQGMVRLAQTGTPALLFPVNSSCVAAVQQRDAQQAAAWGQLLRGVSGGRLCRRRARDVLRSWWSWSPTCASV